MPTKAKSPNTRPLPPGTINVTVNMPLWLRAWVDEIRKQKRWSRGLWIRDLIEREYAAAHQLHAAEDQAPYKSAAATPLPPRNKHKHSA
jgi:hypothetical protein